MLKFDLEVGEKYIGRLNDIGSVPTNGKQTAPPPQF